MRCDAEITARARHVTMDPTTDGSGLSALWATLYAHDAAALDHRLDTMARAVCDSDPRTLEQRRADALGALAAGSERLACACGQPDCPAAQATTEHTVVIHVIAEQATLHDDSDAHLDGNPPTAGQPVHELTLTEALRPAPPTGLGANNPALIIGGTTLPAPIAAKLAARAQLRTIIHPGASPP